MRIQKGKHLLAASQGRNIMLRRGVSKVDIPSTHSSARSNSEIDYIGELRTSESVLTIVEPKLQIETFISLQTNLGDDMRRKRRSPHAVSACLGSPNFWMRSKNQLNALGEIEFVVDVASVTMPMIGQAFQRLFDIGWNTTCWAENVPKQNKCPLASSQQTHLDYFIGF